MCIRDSLNDILTQPNSVIHAFLKGLLNNSTYIEPRIPSETLTHQILFLLHRLGYIPKVIKSNASCKIIISATKQSRRIINNAQTKVEEALLNGDLVLDEVVSIEEHQYNESYDLVVPPTENFITADMVIAHNSEKMANETLMIVNDLAPVVAVFKDIENIMEGESREEETVFRRIRSILSAWLKNEKRRFIAIFTVSEPKQLPPYIIRDPSFGLYKLPILPPFSAEERKKLLTIFLAKLSAKYGLRFDPSLGSVNEALDFVAEKTWLFTPRELYGLAQSAINIALEKNSKSITKEIIQSAKKHVDIDRISRVELIRECVNAAKKSGISESLKAHIYKYEKKMEELRVKSYMEEEKELKYYELSGEDTF